MDVFQEEKKTPEKICSICQSKFHLHEHENGLVFEDKFFVCQSCHSNSSKEEIQEWSKSIMREPGCGMPIALWLIHEQNKNKPLFSQKK